MGSEQALETAELPVDPIEKVADTVDVPVPGDPIETEDAVDVPVPCDPIETEDAVDVLGAIPLKTRTGTSISTCSVATEKGTTETRDYTALEARGTDGSRDGIEDVTILASGATDACAVVKREEAAATSRPLLSEDVEASSSCCVDSMIQHFYSTVELGASKVFSCCVCSSNSNAEPDLTAAELLTASASAEGQKKETQEKQPKHEKQRPSENNEAQEKEKLPSIRNVSSQDTTNTIKTQGTAINGPNVENDEEMSVEVLHPNAKPGCCFTLITCSGGGKEKGKDDQGNLKEAIGDTIVSITSDDVHILDTFSDDITYESVNPKAQSLLNEIEEIEHNFFEVRKSFSKEKMVAVKKRQDPYLQKMATIKQHLQEQQALLQSAPEDTKKEYYRAISRAAILNAEVETRRAELELKKIRLESMRVEDEMDRMMSNEGTFDSADVTLMSKESEDRLDHAFSVIARYTTDNLFRTRKNKTRKSKAVAE